MTAFSAHSLARSSITPLGVCVVSILSVTAAGCAVPADSRLCGVPLTPPPSWFVQVYVDSARECSGAVVAPEWVITARHCVQQVEATQPLAARQVSVALFDGQRGAVVDVRVPHTRYQSLSDLHGRDVALLRLAAPRTGLGRLALSLGDEAPACVVLGRPGAAAAVVVPVSVLAVDSAVVYTEEVTRRGDSGAPLLSRTGALVGISSWHSRDAPPRKITAFSRVEQLGDWVAGVLEE